MARFHPLTVSDIRSDTRNSVVVTLVPDSRDAAVFAFSPGQYLTFRRQFGDEELRRSYSICASGQTLRVGIKRVAGGGFSTWANSSLRVGDRIEAMPPMGRFTHARMGSPAHYLAIAAGSGITPILGIIKTCLETEPDASCTLIYGNRSIGSIMFREEIEDLKNLHMTRLAVHHILSGGSDIEMYSGRMDAEKCTSLFDRLIDVASVSRAYICGPEPMMLTVSQALAERGLAKKDILFELFGAAQTGRLAQRPADAAGTGSRKRCDVRVIIDGSAHEVAIHGDRTSVLDAALAARLDAPFSCKSGVCSTCCARVIEGDYEFATNYALEDYEVARGFVLTCQCFPTGDRLVVDYGR